MPTCTDIVNALNTLAEAVTNPNVLDDLTGQTDVLDGLTATVPSPVQLTAGGNAVLTIPASANIDGVMFTVIAAGRLFTPTGSTRMDVQLVFGDGTSSTPVLISAHETGSIDGFILEGHFVWDSTTQKLKGLVTNSITTGGSVSWTEINVTGVTAQSDVKFSVFGLSTPTFPNAADPTDSVTITQFKSVLF